MSSGNVLCIESHQGTNIIGGIKLEDDTLI